MSCGRNHNLATTFSPLWISTVATSTAMRWPTHPQVGQNAPFDLIFASVGFLDTKPRACRYELIRIVALEFDGGGHDHTLFVDEVFNLMRIPNKVSLCTGASK